MTYTTAVGRLACGSGLNIFMGFLGDLGLGGGRGDMLGLLLSGERARLRVAVVTFEAALRV